ncbi:chemotaxis protein CheW [Kordiimonas sp. SCSIO 12610]|uniref:chemotaxis protein CheW n=1 Tax=Kordiimonas sp. SCSIO 12610 TaxID=2829597 RepID=UPI0021098055|nr:chemotaxis protein CheW [Kordiimonas sp. SCSIO 12610]UTW54551.1 chemotaxis protein CheW [Kordiimonas sp. SCSIO 12610]
MNDLVVREDLSLVATGTQDFVTVKLAGQTLGIPVLAVHDVLNAQQITKIPLAPDWVSGVLNLRGRIVTAIDLRRRLGLEPLEGDKKSMSVVVEHGEEPYSLQIDEVGEVLSLEDQLFERNPVTLDPRWREVSKGIYRLENELLAILDVEKLLAFETNTKAA